MWDEFLKCICSILYVHSSSPADLFHRVVRWELHGDSQMVMPAVFLHIPHEHLHLRALHFTLSQPKEEGPGHVCLRCLTVKQPLLLINPKGLVMVGCWGSACSAGK